MWGYHDGFGWWMMFGGIGMLLFWGVLIAFVYLLVRNLSGSNGPKGRASPLHDAPEEVARRRLASGEITEEEYDRIMSKLSARG